MPRKLKSIPRPRKPRVDIAKLAQFFAQQPDVVVAYLFGSVAKGTARPQSDVDVAVLFDARLDRFARADRFLDLLGRIPSELSTHEFDLRLLNDTTPVFLAQVIGSGEPIYARSRREQIDFEVRAMTEYIDTQPLR
ncbi:MAG: nucleotidyltransferase domain-containing protein, partial [Chloroflexota bacterium]|nr:nucleotidyltransferase domain-containing protein [Chloroflexota bacterium]